MNKLTQKDLYHMLLRGIDDVIENKELINSINVFPVPDSDTGSNLAATLAGIKDNLKSNDASFDQLIDSALFSSQGNSGIMMTAYLSGFLTEIKNAKVIDSATIQKGLKSGFEQARESVEVPRQGTMLDVMETVSAEFEKEASVVNALKAGRNSLVETQSKMEVLAKNHVVDAGALGFTIFIFGLFNQLSDIKFDLEGIAIKPVQKLEDIEFGQFPYEVVFTLEQSQLDPEAVRSMLTGLGDSLDIVAANDKIKVHIHTNQPEVVEQTAYAIGKIDAINTVDMRVSGMH